MNLLRFAWKNLTFKPLSLFMNVVLFALGVGLISLLFVLQKQIEDNFSKNLAGVDLVVGAKGSPLQLILSSMYHIDAPTGNVSLDEVRPFLNPKHPLIETAVPLSMGDSYQGFRVVGTTPDILDLYEAKVAKGRMWSVNMEVVVGAAVAQKLGLDLGDTFSSTHGFQEDENLNHEHSSFRITGILAPNGSVLDQLILSNNQSYWEVHDHGDHDHDEHEGHDHSEHDHAGHDQDEHAGHDHSEHDHDEHDHAGHNHDEHAGHDHDEHDHAGHDHSEHEGHDHDEHDHAGHDHDEHAEHDHDEHDHAGHDHDEHAGHDHDEHDHAGHDHDEHARHDHDEHDHQSASATPPPSLLDSPGDKSITSLLVKFKGRNFQSLSMQRNINENTDMQAATPAIEINRLYALMDTGQDALRVLAIVIIFVSALSIFISLYSSLRERRYELALMRSQGATPGRIFSLILLEGLLLTVLGYGFGMLLSHGGMAILASALEEAYRYSFSAWTFLREEGYLLIGSLLIGVVAALLPAWQASRTDIADTLTGGG
ncbi:MAG: FtsX-like permease family protein [Bacteroidota bacterium]